MYFLSFLIPYFSFSKLLFKRYNLRYLYPKDKRKITAIYGIMKAGDKIKVISGGGDDIFSPIKLIESIENADLPIKIVLIETTRNIPTTNIT